MKILLTFLGLIFVTTTFAFECRPIKGECRPYWNENKECYVEAQSYCDDLLTQHEAKEKQKYELREGKTAPADYGKNSTTTERELGSQTGTIKVLPIEVGFLIFVALLTWVLIKYKRIRK